MRLAVRILCYAMSSAEQAMDEVCNKMMQDRGTKTDPRIIESRKALRQSRRLMAEVLDEMIDKGIGD